MNDIPGHALHSRFLRGLARSPQGTAIQVGGESLTYDAAYELALRWAGALVSMRHEPPRAIAVLADKGVTAYVGILSALFTGATVVPLHPDLPVARTRTMLATSGASVVLADSHGRAVMAETGLDLPVLAADSERAHARVAVLPAPEAVEPGDVAYILFTSGSTGRPKGVPITHGNLEHHFRLMDARYDFGPQDVFSQVLELNFDCAIFEMFSAWAAGGTMCHVPPLAYLDMPSFIEDRGVSVWFSTPSAISLIRRMGGLAPGSLAGLRWSFFAGEALKCSDAAGWQEAVGRGVIENLYGPTELTLTITGHRWSPQTSPELAVNGVVPIGAVYPGHDHLLLTPDGGTSDTEGELCITGPQMTPGYLDESDNEGRFLQRDSGTWYRTGDRVRTLPDGELAYLGRTDSQVQVGGMRVELAEVDHAVRSCLGVIDAVTVTRATQDGLELVTFYTGTACTPVDLTRQLRKILPLGMVPTVFRHVDEFPLNSNRKIDRIQLASSAAGQP